jgi:hypothetical protein
MIRVNTKGGELEGLNTVTSDIWNYKFRLLKILQETQTSSAFESKRTRKGRAIHIEDTQRSVT